MQKILDGEYDDQFPIDIFQAGSGTSTQMNVNEVIANLAAVKLGGKAGDRGRVHPNDHVNKGQSTNNVFPSAIRLASVLLNQTLVAALDRLIKSFNEKRKQFATIAKSGRTHLQDAVPITLGQEFGGYARALTKARLRLQAAAENLLEIGVGGNAVGTGINTKPAFRSMIVEALNKATGISFQVAQDGIEITQFMTDMGQMSTALKAVGAGFAQDHQRPSPARFRAEYRPGRNPAAGRGAGVVNHARKNQPQHLRGRQHGLCPSGRR